MPTKKTTKNSSVLEQLIQTLPDLVLEAVKGSVQHTVQHIHEALENMQKKMLLTLYYYAIVGVSITLLCIAAVLLIDEYLGVSRGWSYLVVGVVLLFGSYLIKNEIHKVKTW